MTLSLAAVRRVFLGAGVYGLVALLPQYVLERQIGLHDPPPITHPEHFYGFVGVAVAWQVAFLCIARDAVRYRTFMLPAALEKMLFAGAVFVLAAQGRVSAVTVGFAAIDTSLACLFVWAFVAVGRPPR